MPNWSFNEIEFRGNKKEALKLKNLIYEWTRPQVNHENGFGNMWLGNIVINAGLSTYEDIDNYKHRCRGEITSIEWDGDILVVRTETAWVPMIKMWKDVLEKHNLDLEIIYIAEEETMDFILTNDPEIAKTYYVSIDGVDMKYEADDDYIISLALDVFGFKSEDVQECIKEIYKCCEVQDIDYYTIQQWEFVDIDDDSIE